MGLSFQNNTPDGMYLAFLRWDPDCPGGDPGQPFSGHGWYRIESGQTVEVWAGKVGSWHLWWGYYAESDAGPFWAGQYAMQVPNNPFHQCYSVGVSGDSVQIGFR